MNTSLKRILPILLAILVLCSIIWYLFAYDRDFTRDLLLQQARLFENNGNHEAAAWFYRQAYSQSEGNQNVAIELAEQFKSVGNYTKAEATLSSAIADGATVELYIALSKTYVEQNKLLDAVTMLENITDPELKAQLDALRPEIPAVTPAAGFYNQYISVEITAATGTLYVSTDREYPSVDEDRYTESISLAAGENTIYALAVGENGLVSRLGVYGYTVAGVVEEITLTDSALDTHLRQLLGFTADQTLLTSDLWSLTELTVPQDVTDYSDLKYLTGLKALTIKSGSFSDLQVLSGLTQLETLTIRDCSVAAEDLAVIAALPNLTRLTLSDCSLSTVEGLSGAKHLTYLDLSENTIRDITALSFMAELQTLNLSHNAVTSLNAVSGLTNLTELNLSNNSLSSLIPLSGCTALTQLDISHNSISGLSGIENMKQLTVFSAAYNDVTDVSILSGCTALTELDISNNAISDISGLAALLNLQSLNFAYNQVTALPAFPSGSVLVHIDGSYNQLTSLSSLSGLNRLNRVIMDYNSISSVDVLASCYNLIQVDIYGNPVSDVSALTDMSVIVNYSPDI